MTAKIVIGGPPHSGKSVFLGALTKLLPRQSYYLCREAVPDGEGTWLGRRYDDPDVVALRRKGRFTPARVERAANVVREWDSTPLMLVDLGGRITPENEMVAREATHAIILAGDVSAIPQWRSFFEQDCGLQVIAVLESAYGASEDRIDEGSEPLSGAVHYLERGVDCTDRPAIQAVAEVLTDLITEAASTPKEGHMEKVIQIDELASHLGKERQERELPNGRIVQQLVWEGSDLPRIAALLHNSSAQAAEEYGSVDIDGPGPGWLALALVHEVHPALARLNSPDGFIPVGCQRPQGEGYGIEWSYETLDLDGIDRPVVKVEFALDPSTPLSPSDLDGIAPPGVPMNAVVVLGGRGPHWLTASVGMAYHGRAAAVAPWQPGTGATVAWTHVSDVPLGHVFDV